MTSIRSRRPLALLVMLAALAGWTGGAFAAGEPAAPGPDANELAKQTQNPVGDVISVPFQFNFNNGGGLGDNTMFNLNFQPVVPIRVSPKWNLIARTIVPFVSAPAGGFDRVGGIGDIQEQLYLTPAQPGGTIVGGGAVVSVPTATNAAIKSGSWAVGPAAVVLKMTGPYVLGALANQLWTYKDEGGAPEINQLLIQPFVNYNFGTGWALSCSPIITANWNAPDGEEWTVPLGLGITRTLVFGKQPLSTGVQYYANVVRPDGAPLNQVRFIFSLIYPTSAKAK